MWFPWNWLNKFRFGEFIIILIKEKCIFPSKKLTGALGFWNMNGYVLNVYSNFYCDEFLLESHTNVMKKKGCQPREVDGLIWHSVFNLLKSVTFMWLVIFIIIFFFQFLLCVTVDGLSNITVMNAKRLIHYNQDSKRSNDKNILFLGETLNTEQQHFFNKCTYLPALHRSFAKQVSCHPIEMSMTRKKNVCKQMSKENLRQAFSFEFKRVASTMQKTNKQTQLQCTEAIRIKQ